MAIRAKILQFNWLKPEIYKKSKSYDFYILKMKFHFIFNENELVNTSRQVSKYK